MPRISLDWVPSGHRTLILATSAPRLQNSRPKAPIAVRLTAAVSGLGDLGPRISLSSPGCTVAPARMTPEFGESSATLR